MKSIKLSMGILFLVVTFSQKCLIGAETTYVRENDLPPIYCTVSQLQNFTIDIFDIIKRINFDASRPLSKPYIKFYSKWGAVKVDADTLNEIIFHSNAPNSIRNLRISIYDTRPVSTYFSISLGSNFNSYSIQGSDRVIIDALESSINRFTKEHRTWVFSNKIKYYIQSMLFALGLLMAFIGFKTKSWIHTIISMACSLSSFFLPYESIFPAFVLLKGERLSFIARYSSEFTFGSFVVGLIGLFLVIFFELRNLKPKNN